MASFDGFALFESTVRDARDARVITSSLQDYHVAVNADVADIEVLLVDEVDPHVSAVGAKGVGELGIVGTSAAIANAIFHATGKRIRDCPSPSTSSSNLRSSIGDRPKPTSTPR